MRRVLAAALMMTLLLCGCKSAANDSQQAALQKRTDLLSAKGCNLSAYITADYGERSYEFLVDCNFVRDGASTVTVKAPDAIAGVTASVSAAGTALNFDGVSLDTGKLPNTELTPVGVLAALGEAWCTAYISNTVFTKWKDTNCLFVSYLSGYGSDEVEYRSWFDRETLSPLYSELVSDGAVVIQVNFTPQRAAAQDGGQSG